MNALGNLVRLLLSLVKNVGGLFTFFTGGKFFRLLIGSVVRTGPQLIVQLLLFFGITMVVNNVAVPEFRNVIVSHITGLPAQWIQFLALTKIDQCITIMLSAFGIVAARKIRLRPANPSLWS